MRWPWFHGHGNTYNRATESTDQKGPYVQTEGSHSRLLAKCHRDQALRYHAGHKRSGGLRYRQRSIALQAWYTAYPEQHLPGSRRRDSDRVHFPSFSPGVVLRLGQASTLLHIASPMALCNSRLATGRSSVVSHPPSPMKRIANKCCDGTEF